VNRLLPLVAVAIALLLAGCGDDTGSSSGGPGQVASGQGTDGSLLGIAQAQQGAQQWWSDHEQALLQRDVKQLARVDAVPLSLVENELIQVAVSTNQGIVPADRKPTAVRVHVPAQQSWPVPVLVGYDVPGSKGVQHLVVLLSKNNPSGSFVATLSAVLDATEPAFDTDPAGYVRMGTPATDLATTYAQWVQATVHGSPAPSPAPLAPGTLTTDAANADAALVHDPGAHSNGGFASVDLDYTQVSTPMPVFDLAGGGGFALLAERRSETLHAVQGQAMVQDAQRSPFGVDLPPGQYPQVSILGLIVMAARIPANSTPAQVIGAGGGVVQEG
jgi:hypothetical protein